MSLSNASNRSPSADEATERAIGLLLRIGVTVAASVVLLGGIALLLRPSPATDYRVFRGEPGILEHASGIIHEAVRFQPGGVIQFGLLLLIATPVARVIFSVWAFARQRDWLYVCVTLIVLGLLLAGLFGL